MRRLKNKIKHQKGMSALQIVIGLGAVGALLTCVLRILPVYIDNWTIRKNLKDLGHSSSIDSMTKEDIVKKLVNGFDLNSIHGAALDNIKVHRRTDGWLINIDYEERIPLVGNLDVILSFENQLNAAKPDDCCAKLIPDVKEN